MKAMLFETAHAPLREACIEQPVPGPYQILLKVDACGVCRTDLHVVDGDLKNPKIPLVPGHEIVGTIVALGPDATRFQLHDRVGVPWLGLTCGRCRYCLAGSENLCDAPEFTGYTLDGGYAEYACADSRYCFALPAQYSDAEAAPLLCAGLIGYRALKMAGDARRIGLYGFGAAAHLVTQLAAFQEREVFAFTRAGDQAAQRLAIEVGATWCGSSDEPTPEPLDAAILFAPVGELVPLALAAVRKGGVVVCAGIHMSAIPSFAYRLRWGERRICSVANLTRVDGEEFFRLAGKVRLQAQVHPYPLHRANEALAALREGRVVGAAVLTTG
jgi:propanol-preferring alcohol dehydrogenase